MKLASLISTTAATAVLLAAPSFIGLSATQATEGTHSRQSHQTLTDTTAPHFWGCGRRC